MSRIPALRTDVIKEQNFERSNLEAAKKGILEEE
jgi:hypothetical protein